MTPNVPHARDLLPEAHETRVRVGTALALIELACQVLAELPGSEIALAAQDPELFRYLKAGETALGWLVGQGEENTLDCPGSGSAFGDGLRIFGWSDEETERRFQAALRQQGAH